MLTGYNQHGQVVVHHDVRESRIVGTIKLEPAVADIDERDTYAEGGILRLTGELSRQANRTEPRQGSQVQLNVGSIS